MFSIGQTVLYGSNGVCTVEDITVKSVGSVKMEYYVLKPLCSGNSTLFVPTANTELVGKMRCVLTPEEANRILSDLPECGEWLEPKNERSERFREIISRGDCAELIWLVRSVHFHGEEQVADGKRLHVSDERFMKDAEKMICDELSLVLGVDREEVLARVLK